MAKLTRGIRNNNPGNIRRSEGWRGLCLCQKDVSFCQFKTMEWGIRALIITLRSYVRLHHLQYVPQMINRWAPESDNNNTLAYIKQVAKAVGNGDEQAGLNYEFTAKDFTFEEGFLSSDHLFNMVKEMCKIESQYNLERGMFEKVMGMI